MVATFEICHGKDRKADYQPRMMVILSNRGVRRQQSLPVEKSNPHALEQRQADRREATAAAKTRLVIRTRLMVEGRTRDLAMFNLAIDSKLRGCDVVAIRVEDVAAGGYTADRATVRQKKTGRPVRFEMSEQTRQAIDDYLKAANKRPGEFLFRGRRGANSSMTTRQYARLVSEWIGSVGLDQRLFGTHSLRRTKASLIYRRTGNLRAVQLLLGHTKIESTVRYLGIEVDDALAIAEQVDV
jgi:integrase